jgi:3-deoxy-7-phosphoheptulonate synthase
MAQGSKEYKLIARDYNKQDRVIKVGKIKIGAGSKVIMAGPCSVENEAQITRIAKEVKKAGAQILRGGAYKPRSSPYAFQGLGVEGLKFLAKARKETGLPIITEATGTHHHHIHVNGKVTKEEKNVLDNVLDYTDILQIGTRNMKSYGFLEMAARETGKRGIPILLKRGESSTLHEFLLAAEYLVANGNPDVILCLRGIRSFEETGMQRYTADIGAIPVLKKECNLPVIFDPSHASGFRENVPALAKAAIAAGADGLIIEVHYDPDKAASDGRECITADVLKKEIINKIKRL